MSAPFAFLGPAWDGKLSEAYLATVVQHLLKSRGPKGLFTPGFYGKAPLERMIAGYVTDDLLQAIAVEHGKGRRLFGPAPDPDSDGRL